MLTLQGSDSMHAVRKLATPTVSERLRGDTEEADFKEAQSDYEQSDFKGACSECEEAYPEEFHFEQAHSEEVLMQ